MSVSLRMGCPNGGIKKQGFSVVFWLLYSQEIEDEIVEIVIYFNSLIMKSMSITERVQIAILPTNGSSDSVEGSREKEKDE